MLEKYKGTLEIQWSFLAFHTYVICLVLFFLFLRLMFIFVIFHKACESEKPTAPGVPF